MLSSPSFALCNMQKASRSFQSPAFGVPGLSRTESNSHCMARLCKGSGGFTVPWSIPMARTTECGIAHHCATLVACCSLAKEMHKWLILQSSWTQSSAWLALEVEPRPERWSSWVCFLVTRLEFVEPADSRQLHLNCECGRRKDEAWASVSWKVSCLAPGQSLNTTG